MRGAVPMRDLGSRSRGLRPWLLTCVPLGQPQRHHPAARTIQPQRGDSTFGLVGYSNNGRPVGAWMQGGIRFQGLTPNAADFHSIGGGGELSGSAFLRSVFWNLVVFGRLG